MIALAATAFIAVPAFATSTAIVSMDGILASFTSGSGELINLAPFGRADNTNVDIYSTDTLSNGGSRVFSQSGKTSASIEIDGTVSQSIFTGTSRYISASTSNAVFSLTYGLASASEILSLSAHSSVTLSTKYEISTNTTNAGELASAYIWLTAQPYEIVSWLGPNFGVISYGNLTTQNGNVFDTASRASAQAADGMGDNSNGTLYRNVINNSDTTVNYLIFSEVDVRTSANNALPMSPVANVPEPETYAMLLAGLGLIGATVRRRKAKQG